MDDLDEEGARAPWQGPEAFDRPARPELCIYCNDQSDLPRPDRVGSGFESRGVAAPPSRKASSSPRPVASTSPIIGLYKTEVIRRCGPWRNLEEVEFATLEWVDWFNNRRLFGPLGNIPPAEFEALYDGTRESQATGVRLN